MDWCNVVDLYLGQSSVVSVVVALICICDITLWFSIFNMFCLSYLILTKLVSFFWILSALI